MFSNQILSLSFKLYTTLFHHDFLLKTKTLIHWLLEKSFIHVCVCIHHYKLPSIIPKIVSLKVTSGKSVDIIHCSVQYASTIKKAKLQIEGNFPTWLTERLNWRTYPSVLKDVWEQREKPSSLLVFIRALIPFVKAPPSWPHLILIISQRLQLLILSHCRGRVPGHKYWYSQVFIKRFCFSSL